jgi:hypothetical protein
VKGLPVREVIAACKRLIGQRAERETNDVGLGAGELTLIANLQVVAQDPGGRIDIRILSHRES